jgi:hypothetical protein
MSAKRSEGYRPQLESLEDRAMPSGFTLRPTMPLTAPVVHVGINHQPAFIFNPFQQESSRMTVPGFSSFAPIAHPSDGGFFPPGLGNNFFPPSIFHF